MELAKNLCVESFVKLLFPACIYSSVSALA